MATKAYILIRTEVGKTSDIATAMRSITGVTAVDLVSGPYDIVAVAEGQDANAVGRLVLNQMHGLEGLCSTLTCVVIG
ncbi:MAG: Lrp/AsnC ligand binding domain-containing protein [Bacteroidetes bacterium]|nr:Lrp/AsnC ligand binding domain-containing protein [Bacteroidota bacterium]MCL5026055.1 Lrp/AsnC ligand binding domain-containing protein [Chloroflexota bacterium]